MVRTVASRATAGDCPCGANGRFTVPVFEWRVIRGACHGTNAARRRQNVQHRPLPRTSCKVKKLCFKRDLDRSSHRNKPSSHSVHRWHLPTHPVPLRPKFVPRRSPILVSTVIKIGLPLFRTAHLRDVTSTPRRDSARAGRKEVPCHDVSGCD